MNGRVVQQVMDFGTGLVIGGLGMSAAWGLFWLAIGLVGLRRGTCSGRVVLNSLLAGLAPMGLIVLLLWWRGVAPEVGLFGAGLVGMPLLLAGLGCRKAPDGQRAGSHMLGGVRHLKDELLGRHRGCGGCSQEHDYGGCG